MKFLKAQRRNLGDGRPLEKEVLLKDVEFKKFKFNNRPVPKDKNNILIITCFTEFGCETIGTMYCIPKVIEQNAGKYIVCVGWYGREYLYRHLVDEFWELPESCQFLREFTMAFVHTSKNLSNIEKKLEQFGNVYKSQNMGSICLGNTCLDCKNFWGETKENLVCPKCGSKNLKKSIFNDIQNSKKEAVNIPRPKENMLEKAKIYLKENPVGVYARGRVCYGRNLPPDFYVKLIKRLEDRGYNPIWLGEKQSVLPCPVPHILDFSRMPESRDLELVLAIISHLKFTVQFWTASTRLASAMKVPWLLFESPNQIVGNGQEGIRIALTTDEDKKKLVLSNYFNVLENQEDALNLVDSSIDEIEANDWKEVVGMVDEVDLIKQMLQEQKLFWKGLKNG